MLVSAFHSRCARRAFSGMGSHLPDISTHFLPSGSNPAAQSVGRHLPRFNSPAVACSISASCSVVQSPSLFTHVWPSSLGKYSVVHSVISQRRAPFFHFISNAVAFASVGFSSSGHAVPFLSTHALFSIAYLSLSHVFTIHAIVPSVCCSQTADFTCRLLSGLHLAPTLDMHLPSFLVKLGLHSVTMHVSPRNLPDAAFGSSGVHGPLLCVHASPASFGT